MLLSIIIPCYNSGRFIRRSIEMLLRQGLSDCELILVNDGSTDDTLFLLREYERAYPDIYVIDHENQGVSVARNKGLAAARGEYVYFLDSDDTLTDGSLAYFKRTIAGHPDCQMFAFGYESRRGDVVEKKYISSRFDHQEISGRVLTRNFLAKRFCVHIGSCVYKRTFLIENQFYFPSGVTIGEDVLFLLRTLFQVDKAYYSQRVSFIYQIRDDSTMRGYKSYSRAQYRSHTMLRDFLLPIAKRDKKMRKYINFFLLFSYISNLRYYLCADFKDEEINRRFIHDSDIRFRKNFIGNIAYWMAMKLMIFVPIRFVLKLFKS